MGKGKGKAGRKEAKLAVKKINQEPKIPGLPRPEKPAKKAKKILPREKKSLHNNNPPGPASFPIPTGRPKPFTKSPQHAKWPAMFKKHLGVIEAHIRNLDRVMQSMKSEMAQMSPEMALEWELGERGNWRAICQMMDRAREVLASARECAKGILPAKTLKDKKGLGVAGTNFEPLGPRLDAKAEALGYDTKGKGALGKDTLEEALTAGAIPSDHEEDSDDSNADADSDSSDYPDEPAAASDPVNDGLDYVPLFSGAKSTYVNGLKIGDSEKENTALVPNPYFIVDTLPTPVAIDPNAPKKENKTAKKLRLRAEREARKLKKEQIKQEKLAFFAKKAAEEAHGETVAAAKPVESSENEVDFTVLESALQAEIEEGTRKQRRAEEHARKMEEKAAKKKRKRESEGDEEVVEKKAKIEETENSDRDVTGKKSEKKRRRSSSSSDEDVTEKKAKKDKTEKKDNKRRPNAGEDGGEKNKKRKQDSDGEGL